MSVVGFLSRNHQSDLWLNQGETPSVTSSELQSSWSVECMHW